MQLLFSVVSRALSRRSLTLVWGSQTTCRPHCTKPFRPRMPTRKQKKTSASVWRVHCQKAGRRFPARLETLARIEDGVTIGPRPPTNRVCDLTFATPCKWDRVRNWVRRALGKPERQLDIYPVDGPVATDVDPLPVSAPRAAPASALAFAPSAAPDAAPSARLTLAEFKTIHEPGNIYVGNVVSAYPGFC